MIYIVHFDKTKMYNSDTHLIMYYFANAYIQKYLCHMTSIGKFVFYMLCDHIIKIASD